MTTKKKSPNQNKENNPIDTFLSSTTQLAGTGLLSSILTKGFKLDNPFIDDRDIVIVTIGKLVNEYSKICSDNTFWEREDYKNRKAAYNDLKQKKKRINQLLNGLIPKGATNKKGNSFIREIKNVPEAFVLCVESRTQTLEKLLKEYKKKYKYKNRSYLIDKILEDELNIDKPNNIYIDNRSVTTITISILAYLACVSFDTLYPIYNSVDIEKRKDILKNPNKYFPFLSQT